MKCRLFLFDNEVETYFFIWKKKMSDETELEFMDRMSINHPNCPEKFKNVPFVDLNENEIPTNIDPDIPLFFDGLNIKRDIGFENYLMRLPILEKKHLKILNNKIKDEFNKEKIADPVKLVRLQWERDDCKNWTTKQWYEQALKNLDERVAGGESDKPVIREKLLAKIEELKTKEKE